MEIQDKQRNILLLASVIVLALALLLWRGLPMHPHEHVAALLRDRGYTVEVDQLYNAGSFPNQSIRGALEGIDLQQAVEASLAGGFPSRVEQIGDVELLLCAMQNQDVITIFLLDGEVELCFVQSLLRNTLKPLSMEEGQ